MSDLCLECGQWYYPGKDGKHINIHRCMGKIIPPPNCTCYSCDCGKNTCWICTNGVPPPTYIPCFIHNKCSKCDTKSIDINGKYVGPLCTSWMGNILVNRPMCYWCRTLFERG